MPAPPAKAEISAPYPNPSNAVARDGFGKMWETLFGVGGLLGSSGTAADARAALEAAPLASPAFTGSPTAPNPATGTRSTAVATMQKFADEFGSSLAGSGYQRLPSGLIIQWGVLSGAGGLLGGSFPLTFPTAVYRAVVSLNAPSSTTMYSLVITSISVSTIQVNRVFGSGSPATEDVFYIAIGR